MPIASITVKAAWDEGAEVWVASSSDIDGLAIEAPTWDALGSKVLAALSALVELNGIDSDLAEIPVQIVAERRFHVPNVMRAQCCQKPRVVQGNNSESDVPDARTALFERLECQPVMNAGRWTRDELYEERS